MNIKIQRFRRHYQHHKRMMYKKKVAINFRYFMSTIHFCHLKNIVSTQRFQRFFFPLIHLKQILNNFSDGNVYTKRYTDVDGGWLSILQIIQERYEDQMAVYHKESHKMRGVSYNPRGQHIEEQFNTQSCGLIRVNFGNF